MSRPDSTRIAPPRADVVIVGAGIAGCALAAALAEGGHSIVLVEANALPAATPTLADSLAEIDARVSALAAASTRLLAAVGAWDRIPDAARAPYTRMVVWEEDGTGRIEFEASELHEEVLGHIVENRWIAGALLGALVRHANVRVLVRERLRGFEYGGGLLRVRLESGALIDASLLVGADGAQSSVRQLAAIGGQERDCHQRAIVATIRTSDSHRMTARQVFLQSGPLAFLPLRDPNIASIVWSADNPVAEELLALDDAAFAARLERAGEYDLGRVTEVTPRQSFPLRQHHAASYVAEHIALVADAAHVVHPLAGQGINMGLADVRVLSEEIGRAHARGLAPGDATALGRYHRRRRADNELMLRAMSGLQQLYGARHPVIRLGRNIGLRAVQQFPPLKRRFMRHAMGL